MESIILLIVLLVSVAGAKFVIDRVKGFANPASMSDKEILSAIAGQADWLERQLHHVAKYGGAQPYPELAECRREYIVSLCEALLSRHAEPVNLMYNATKRARELEAEGVPRKTAVVQGVKQRLFEENGHTYIARWHPAG